MEKFTDILRLYSVFVFGTMSVVHIDDRSPRTRFLDALDEDDNLLFDANRILFFYEKERLQYTLKNRTCLCDECDLCVQEHEKEKAFVRQRALRMAEIEQQKLRDLDLEENAAINAIQDHFKRKRQEVASVIEKRKTSMLLR